MHHGKEALVSWISRMAFKSITLVMSYEHDILSVTMKTQSGVKAGMALGFGVFFHSSVLIFNMADWLPWKQCDCYNGNSSVHGYRRQNLLPWRKSLQSLSVGSYHETNMWFLQQQPLCCFTMGQKSKLAMHTSAPAFTTVTIHNSLWLP